ncbi:hypothetical protein AVEN_152205-1 [Araneus ventricosus]|uniref:Uncharacterized protein n=1 Tax=Araneus ventricosus TaxID=182803 RepID=A0A4Y2HKX4_ARAVE|nr:hypothetical protein AVEN_152205-1 [Araneus ventricosus]
MVGECRCGEGKGEEVVAGAVDGLEEGGGMVPASESSKSSDMSYSKASSSDKEEELISASASDSRDCKSAFSNGGRTAIGRSSVSTEVGLGVANFTVRGRVKF